MKELEQVLAQNKAWAEKRVQEDDSYFSRLASGQSPRFLWIGCADSRVPANNITALEPGELFVHRNIANSFYQTDMNALSVLHYAVEVLEVQNIIVCGHYGCGGIQSALTDNFDDLPMHWVQPIRTMAEEHQKELSKLNGIERVDKMCEINVMYQVNNIVQSSIVQKRWLKGHYVSVTGLIYNLEDGLLNTVTPVIDQTHFNQEWKACSSPTEHAKSLFKS